MCESLNNGVEYNSITDKLQLLWDCYLVFDMNMSITEI